MSQADAEREARAEICAAILDLTLQIKARLVADLESRPAPQTVETNEIEIPAVLGPEQIDWLSSRPVRPSRWRVRSQSNSNLWDWREISLIEVSATDLAAALCDDFSSVPLPDSIEQAAPPRDDREFLTRHARGSVAEWTPPKAAIDAIPRLRERETIPLSEVVALIAGDPPPPVASDHSTISDRRKLAEASFFAGVWTDDHSRRISMRGAPAGSGNQVAPIPDSYFLDPSYIRSDQNSLRPVDDEGQLTTETWNNVVVEAATFRGWLDHEATRAGRRQFQNLHSLRLFHYPFWSVATTICWLAFRNPLLLEVRQEGARSLLGQAFKSEPIESQPEIQLLGALRRGTLVASERGHDLRPTLWRNARPRPGGLSTASRLTRFDRERVLNIFPELSEDQRAAVVERRQSKIDQIVLWLNRTGRWINCQEFRVWLQSQGVRRAARRSNPVEELVKRQIEMGPESRLRLLNSHTSVVRLSDWPIAHDQEDTDLVGDGVLASELDYFANYWAPNAMCRDLAEGLSLVFPLHFQMFTTVGSGGLNLTVTSDRHAADAAVTHKTAAGGGSVEHESAPSPGERKKKVGRKLQITPYMQEFELRLTENRLEMRLQQEADAVKRAVDKDVPTKKRVKQVTIENCIRKRLETWDGPIPWKSQ